MNDLKQKKSMLTVNQDRCGGLMDVGDATSTTSMDVVKVGLENQVGLE